MHHNAYEALQMQVLRFTAAVLVMAVERVERQLGRSWQRSFACHADDDVEWPHVFGVAVSTGTPAC